MDDQALILLVYYFCNGISINAVADTLNLSRKTVRAHYMELRRRLTKPKFMRWHRVYSALAMIPDPKEELRLKGTLIELLATCYNSKCYGNYVSGNRKNRICRQCPLRPAYGDRDTLQTAVEAVDAISALYRRIGIRNDTIPDHLTAFFERFIHAGVIACLHESSERRADGLFDPADTDYEGAGTLLQMLMDDLADDNAPRIENSER